MPPPIDDRAWIDKLVFGRENTRRFTQDSPVVPDVWIAFAQAPDDPVSLLLAPNMEPSNPGGATSTGALRRALAERLPKDRARAAAWCRRGRKKAPPPELAHNQATVLASLWFDELVRVILPMCIWWKERVHSAGLDLYLNRNDPDVIASLAAMLENPDFSAEKLGLPPGQQKPAPDLLWTARVVGTIALVRKDKEWLSRLSTEPKLGPADFRKIAAAATELFEGVEFPDYETSPLVWSVNRNRKAETTVERSRQAVKADAAIRVFDAVCDTLTWAVIDSGLDATHPAFRQRDPATKKPYAEAFPGGVNRTRVKGTYDFNYVQHLLSSAPGADANFPGWLKAKLKADGGLRRQLKELRRDMDAGGEVDWAKLTPFIQIPHDDAGYQPPVHEHGTHVAGILAADWVPPAAGQAGPTPPPGGLHGVCPDIRLFDLRVLDAQGAGEEFNINSALQFVRYINGRQDFMAAHGVNLSLSLRHDVANYACGRTPICEECHRLVSSGVVVVAAGGNRGFQRYQTAAGLLDSYHSISITDPGNAAGVITVGATHRTQPHTYGVSYFSSRGPTGDGRVKPDLVAPGEKIEGPVPGGSYKRMDGTSMAAPHVSGVAALLLARHRELIGQPAEVKAILCRTATDLGRERHFQGHGMVDALRALQSV